MTVIAFIVTGIIFLALSFLMEEIWAYYVPGSLLLLSVWLKVIQPKWNVDVLQTKMARMDPSAAAGYVSIISIIYAVVCIFLGYWIALSGCVFLFILSLTMRFPHPC
jgi:hypothetical protein